MRPTHNHCALTLIELLMAMTLGILLMVVVIQGMMATRSFIARQRVVLSMHATAAAIHQRIGAAVMSVHPCAPWRLEASPGATPGWDDGDERWSLTWMGTVSHPIQAGYWEGRTATDDVLWFRIACQRNGSSTDLRFASSSPSRTLQQAATRRTGTATTANITIVPFTRRDRRRPLDDNDLRMVPGSGGPGAYGAIGDDTDLDQQLLTLLPPEMTISQVVIGWRDARGIWTGIDPVRHPNRGVDAYDRLGALVARQGNAWSNDRNELLDGLWLSGSTTPDPATGDATDILARRPQVLQLAFTLTDDSILARSSTPVSRRFAFSFPLSPILESH